MQDTILGKKINEISECLKEHGESKDKNLMSYERFVIRPDAPNNVNVLCSQQQLWECRDSHRAFVIAVKY